MPCRIALAPRQTAPHHAAPVRPCARIAPYRNIWAFRASACLFFFDQHGMGKHTRHPRASPLARLSKR
ncbi:MAG: hypothetical protein LBC18_07440 [Opitutaceae bacterium]|nr:hypothetical protein [Opitutaceae bacterium]